MVVYRKAASNLNVQVTSQVSNATLSGNKVILPTIICNPIIMSKFFPDEWRTIIVAIASATTPHKQKITPIVFNLLVVPAFIMKITPNKPINKPLNPSLLKRSFKKNHEKMVTMRGRRLAIIAARLASIHCIATKFKPR